MSLRTDAVVSLGAFAGSVALVGLTLLLRGSALTSARGRASTPSAGSAVAEPPDAPDAGPSPFVAFSRDFEDFRTWEQIPVEGAMRPIGAGPGPTSIYVNARPLPGARRWPVGTILVKSIEGGDPSEWVIHAMVKRGVPYNRDGTIGWEFFELAFAPGQDRPHVVWRGPGPPSGHGYAVSGRDAGPDPVALVCNDCHAAAWQSDGALTPALAFAP